MNLRRLCVRLDADQHAGQASDAKRIAPFPSRSTRMRKALRGYAKDKNGNLILIGTMPVPFSKDKCAPAVRQQKNIWLGKVQRSLGKKRFVNRPLDRTPAKSRRRIGRLRQFQRRARAARSRLESRGYAYGPKN